MQENSIPQYDDQFFNQFKPMVIEASKQEHHLHIYWQGTQVRIEGYKPAPSQAELEMERAFPSLLEDDCTILAIFSGKTLFTAKAYHLR